jgi:hypothetical protein
VGIRSSLKAGTLRSEIGDESIVIPVQLGQMGRHTYKMAVESELPEEGPISRTHLISVLVGSGKADPKKTTVSHVEVSAKGMKGVLVRITPKNSHSQFLGPGLAHEFETVVGKEKLGLEVEDLLDGGYRIESVLPAEKWATIEESGAPVRITFQGKLVWKR